MSMSQIGCCLSRSPSPGVRVGGGVVLAVLFGVASGRAEVLPAGDVVMRAMVDELERATGLQMPGLEPPYFVQYTVEDAAGHVLVAEQGALTADSPFRERDFRVVVRVGEPGLDNSNFDPGGGLGGGGVSFGGQARLPVSDDYLALRQGIWLATDREYKSAVETLTRKRAYLRDRTVADRPPDFSGAPVVKREDPVAVLDFEAGVWAGRVRALSAVFREHEAVQENSIRLVAGRQNIYLVNSEGTRLRYPDTGVLLAAAVQVRAADGMRLGDGRLYVGRTLADLPAPEEIEADLRAMVAGLEQLREAPVLDRYSGPVLFDGVSGAQLFQVLIGRGLAGQPDVVGQQRREQGPDNLEYKLGTRLLPPSFQVWDDATAAVAGARALLGHYPFDDEGVAARRVELVKDGRLTGLCLARSPVRKLGGSTGHGRSTDGSAPRASVANLFIADQKGLPAAELKAELLAAARDEGLDHAIRVEALRVPSVLQPREELIRYFTRTARSGAGKIPDPVAVYRVSVADGSETRLRGAEFGRLELRSLRHILAAGDEPRVFNHLGIGLGGAEPGVAVIAPPVLIEEAELTRIQEELEQPPILKPPGFRR